LSVTVPAKDDPPPLNPAVRIVMVGCMTVFTGFFAGGMIAVFIGKIVEGMKGCTPEEGLPICHWHVYAAVGMVIGATLFPAVALIKLRRARVAKQNSNRG
jgi:TRAP-type C4-dicarboxylate transport system permease small subunit